MEERIAVVFPGQGSQYVGMGEKLFNVNPKCRQVFSQASKILGNDFLNLLFHGDIDELSKPHNNQPATLIVSYAYYVYFIDKFGYYPTMLAGHSLGEITALVCSNSISFVDGVKLAKIRGEIIEKNIITNGCMIAIMGNNFNEYIKIIADLKEKGKKIDISAINSPTQMTVAGIRNDVLETKILLEEKGAMCLEINLEYPFHTTLMNDTVNEFDKFLEQIDFKMPTIPVVSSVDGNIYGSTKNIRKNLSIQLNAPVLWKECMDTMINEKIDVFYELGPRGVLRNLYLDQNVSIFSLDNPKDLNDVICKFDNNYEICTNVKYKINAIKQVIKYILGCKNFEYDVNSYRSNIEIPYIKLYAYIYPFLDEIDIPSLYQIVNIYLAANKIIRHKFNSEKDANKYLNRLIINMRLYDLLHLEVMN